jgi:hypothetical protein
MLTTKGIINHEQCYLRLSKCSKMLEKESIVIGVRKLYQLLRETNIVSEENYVLSPYDELNYFDFELLGIYSPHGKKVAWHTKILVSNTGYKFLKQHIKDNLDLIKPKRKKRVSS